MVTKIAAWIRLTNLPLDYYDKGILYVLGSQIGKVLKVDMTTLKRKKGWFARLCVELNLANPLPLMILIDGEEQRVQYEGIHSICFQCVRYGHDRDHCSFQMRQKSEPRMEIRKEHVEGKMVVEEGDIGGCEVTHGEAGMNNEAMVELKEERYTEWKLVQRPRRSRRLGVAGMGEQAIRHNSRTQGWNGGRGSRFSTLEMEEITDLEVMDRGSWEKEISREFTPLKSSTKPRLFSRNKSETVLQIRANGVDDGRKVGPISLLKSQMRQGGKRPLGSQGESSLLDWPTRQLGHDEDALGPQAVLHLISEDPGTREAVLDGPTSHKGNRNIAAESVHVVAGSTNRVAGSTNHVAGANHVAGGSLRNVLEEENISKTTWLTHEAMEEDKDPSDPGTSRDGFYMVHSNPLSGDLRLEEAPRLAGVGSSSDQVGQ